MLKQAKGWMARGGLALLVISGVALFDGERIEAQDEAALTKVSERHVVSSLMDIDRLPDDVRWVKGVNLKNAHLEFLVSHKSIEILDLRGCAIGLEGLRKLSELPKLWSLDLRDSSRLSRGNRTKAIDVLTGMSGLTELGLDAWPFLVHEEKDISEVPVDKPSYVVDEASTRKIGKRFDTLRIGGCSKLDSKEFRKLVDQLPKVVGWDLTDYKELTDEDLGYLAKKGHALSLTLTGCTCITELGLGFVARYTRIREMYMEAKGYRVKFDDAALFQIGKMAHLQYLVIGDFYKITDDGVGYLGNLKELETLILTGKWKITGTGFKGLARAPALKFLHLESCSKITNDSIAHLASIKTLEVLTLDYCGTLDRSMLKHLAKLPKLRELHLKDLPLMRNRRGAEANESRKMSVSVSVLEKMTNLRILVMPLYTEELKSLRQKLPECKITTE